MARSLTERSDHDSALLKIARAQVSARDILGAIDIAKRISEFTFVAHLVADIAQALSKQPR